MVCCPLYSVATFFLFFVEASNINRSLKIKSNRIFMCLCRMRFHKMIFDQQSSVQVYWTLNIAYVSSFEMINKRWTLEYFCYQWTFQGFSSTIRVIWLNIVINCDCIFSFDSMVFYWLQHHYCNNTILVILIYVQSSTAV